MPVEEVCFICHWVGVHSPDCSEEGPVEPMVAITVDELHRRERAAARAALIEAADDLDKRWNEHLHGLHVKWRLEAIQWLRDRAAALRSDSEGSQP